MGAGACAEAWGHCMVAPSSCCVDFLSQSLCVMRVKKSRAASNVLPSNPNLPLEKHDAPATKKQVQPTKFNLDTPLVSKMQNAAVYYIRMYIRVPVDMKERWTQGRHTPWLDSTAVM